MNAPPGSRRAGWSAILATTATYVYFLIFAQFGLLALAERAGWAAHLRPLMAAMGAGGIVGAGLAAKLFRPEHGRAVLAVGFALCALGAGLALAPLGLIGSAGTFGLVGVALGGTTVALAAQLRGALGARLGLGLGGATGAAYALCNLPPIFTADPVVQARIAVVAATVGAVAVLGFPAARSFDRLPPARGIVAGWVVGLTALVWLDSAAFYVIQQTPALRAETWVGEATLLANAAVHLVAALAAGALLDRGWARAPLLLGIGLLGAASVMLAGLGPRLGAGWLYVAGVSLYSVALVYLPASTGSARVAALVYGIAGWIGSALGIGMAQDLHRVPAWAVALATGAVLAACARRFAPVLAAGCAMLALTPPAGAADDPVAAGREVYIREGCMHCHSQFVRPRVPQDVERWGPATELGPLFAEQPPLPGNRRQGPDLAHVGNRRSAEWNRLHLLRPRDVSPGSRMPSYAHLFGGGDDSPGEALVVYLATLGADTIPQRLAQARAWRPAAVAGIGEAEARRLFATLCRNCHGDAGRGDGPLAARLSVAPPDWTAGRWRHVAPDADVDRELARLIKFGLPGSPMAGHEYLRDAEIVGLARLVRAWQKGSPQ